jgi:TonB family protein
MRSLTLTLCVAVTVAAADLASPARYLAGAVPSTPVRAIGGGQVFLELSVNPRGGVDAVAPLRTTPPFTEPLLGSVGAWRFKPAEELTPEGTRRPARSKVLVAAFYRGPTLLDGATLGDSPKDVAAASDAAPFPVAPVSPKYPPNALGDGTVLIEVQVNAGGNVTNARVIQSALPFDAPALDAARQWKFRPARPDGRPAAAVAYLIFGFRQPVT